MRLIILYLIFYIFPGILLLVTGIYILNEKCKAEGVICLLISWIPLFNLFGFLTILLFLDEYLNIQRRKDK